MLSCAAVRGTLGTVLLICAAFTPNAQARSVLDLPYPSAFGLFDAGTYDENGSRLGAAQLEIVKLRDGRVRMTATTGIDRGASNVASILLAPVVGTHRLRALEQRSESRDAAGRSLGVLHIDHEAGIGRCTPPGDAGQQTIELPEQERIANVALHLLFSPIAQGEASGADFQLFVCLGGPRVIEFSAMREPREPREPRVDAGSGIVEIRYKPDLGGTVDWLFGQWLPQFSFWLDGEGNYLAHRIPLYTKGPEVLVVRSGISPHTLTAAP
jgi:hypothetical protein